MKKIILIGALLFILPISLFALKSVNFISSISDHSSLVGYAVGENGKIIKTTDGGSFWYSQNSNILNTLNSVFMVTNEKVYAAGDSGSILLTTNGGVNWVEQNSFIDSHINSIFFVDSTTGFAAANNGIILRTSDGGVNWTSISLGTGENLNEVYFYDLFHGTVVGNNATVRTTTNAGLTWNSIPTTGIFGDMSSVYSATNKIFVSNRNGSLFYSTTSGITWTTVSIPASSINSFKLRGLNFGISVGDSGQIFNSMTPEVGWKNSLSPITENLHSVCLIDSSKAWAVGDNDCIIKTTNGGENWSLQTIVDVNKIGTKVPSSFSLKQNYPNPFNPVTRINFDLPENGRVKLIVYDLLGRQITSLLNNELKTAGEYTVEFNGANLSSGIYFYRLETNKFVNNKRMVLTK